MSHANARQPKKKRIVIFADGTGNAFSTQESNVWRLFQALDKRKSDQIAHYIRGVGTSGFRPWALIDGATGFGVPSNVRELYRFLCWNYEPEDEIYLFGFSRGAFTVRTLLALTSSQGLLRPTIEYGEDKAPIALTGDEMSHLSRAAWRKYRKHIEPANSRWIIWIGRWLRDKVVALRERLSKRLSYSDVEPHMRRDVAITFLGVFDTVEAYGVPFEFLRRPIDWLFWPMQFRNQKLPPNVLVARHALSLDDERTTFHPIPIQGLDTADLQQVWFAGAHSDVGGGYPDAALAHIPLVWMAREVMSVTGGRDALTKRGKKCPWAGLDFQDGAIDAFERAASAFQPIHDSRSGLAVTYRYSPRQLLNSDRWPDIILHHSVACKMTASDTAQSYTPLMLPRNVKVVMRDGRKCDLGYWSLTDPERGERVLALDETLLANTHDLVWWRRVLYVLMVVSFGLVALAPWLFGNVLDFDEVGNFRNFMRASTSVLGLLLPGWAAPWLGFLEVHPFAMAVLVALAISLYVANGWMRQRINEQASLAWSETQRDAMASRPTKRDGGVPSAGRFCRKTLEHAQAVGTSGATPSFARSGLPIRLRIARWFRTNKTLGRIGDIMDNWVLPWIVVCAFLFSGCVLVSRTSVTWSAPDLCKRTAEHSGANTQGTELAMPASDRCWASGVRVTKGERYRVSVTFDHGLFDGPIMSDAAGFGAAIWKLPALPFARWWSAPWLHPIARIADKDGHGGEWPLRPLHQREGTAGVEASRATLLPDTGLFTFWDLSCRPLEKQALLSAEDSWRKTELKRSFTSEFTAEYSGELYLYLNDAMLRVPFVGWIDCAYQNNAGTARVDVRRLTDS